MEDNTTDISIKAATEELLNTRIFRNIAQRNSPDFAKKLAIWLIRYLLMISSMKEALKLNLETILLNLHGEKLKKILQITEKTFNSVQQEERDKSNQYIW
jgi:hypothetical protein